MSIRDFFSSDHKNFIVADEDTSTNYAEYLLITWLQEIRKKNVKQPIQILLFSNPKYCLEKLFKLSNLTDIEIHDFFSIELQNEERNVLEELTNVVNVNSDSIIVVDCLSTLALQIGVAKACRFVEKLNQNHKHKVFCIFRRDIYLHIPRLETLGDVYIKLKNSKKPFVESNVYYEVSIIHKKPGGGIARWNELIKQNLETFLIEAEKIREDVKKMPINLQPQTNIMPQTTFRIDLSESEMKQRDSVPLPYILPGNPGSGGSQIIYVPDEVDDLDEEDPDDDLDF